MASRKAGSFTVTTATTVISRCTSSRGSICCAPGCGVPISMGPRDRWRNWNGSSAGFGRARPEVSIVIRADSGFCRDDLLRWCEDHHVDYVMGLANNDRLKSERRSDDSGRSRVQRHRASSRRFPLPDSPQLDDSDVGKAEYPGQTPRDNHLSSPGRLGAWALSNCAGRHGEPAASFFRRPLIWRGDARPNSGVSVPDAHAASLGTEAELTGVETIP